MTKGIRAVSRRKPIAYLSDKAEAVHYVLNSATANSFIAFLCKDASCLYGEVTAYCETFALSIRTAS